MEILKTVFAIFGALGLLVVISYVALYRSSQNIYEQSKKYGRRRRDTVISIFSKVYFREQQEEGLLAGDQQGYELLVRSGKPNLFRHMNDQLPKTVFLIGAGAVEGSWKPLFEAFKSEDKNYITHIFSRAVSLSKEDYGRLGVLPRERAKFVDKLWELRRKIAILIWKSHYSKEMKLRSLPEEFQEKLDSDQTSIVTTNWDNSLIDSTKNNILFLHGHMWSPETILFPTEFPLDEHRVAENTRRGFERLEFARWMAHFWFGNAEELVLWGIALNSYDVELGTLLKSNSFKKISVIDIDPTPARIISFINGVAVNWFDPIKNVSTEVDLSSDINCLNDGKNWDELYEMYDKYNMS